MPKASYLNRADDAFSAQLTTFKNNIGSYATLLSLTAGQVSGQAADADCFRYVLQCQQGMQNSAQQWTAWKALMRSGGAVPASGAPAAPSFPAPVTAVAPGVEVRFRALVQQIKANANYNPSIGEALGIEGAQQTAPDLATVQPVFDVVINGNHVVVNWSWGGHGNYLDMCELQVDRADGKGFVPLAFDTTPGYTDTQPFPAAPAKWTYKAIYRVGDAQVGQWSNPVSITVGG
jgi:hypothetical protein